MPTQVHLIGEVHTDIDRINRYRRIFDKYSPEIITLENNETNIKDCKEIIEKIKSEYELSSPQITNLENFLLGDWIAARTYQQKHKSVQIKLIDWKYDPEIIETEKQRVKHIEESLMELDEKLRTAHLMMMQFSPVDLGQYILKICGIEVFEELLENKFPIYKLDQVDQFTFFLIHNKNEKKTKQFQTFKDCLYIHNIEEDNDTLEVHKMRERDIAMSEEILQLKGTIVHCGGLSHCIGNYNNLYRLLQANNVPTTIHPLIDFYSDNQKETDQYQQMIKALYPLLLKKFEENKQYWEKRFKPQIL